VLRQSGDLLLLAMGCGAGQPPSQPADEWPEESGIVSDFARVGGQPPSKPADELALSGLGVSGSGWWPKL